MGRTKEFPGGLASHPESWKPGRELDGEAQGRAGKMHLSTSYPPDITAGLLPRSLSVWETGQWGRGRQLKRESMKIQEAKRDRKDRGGAPWAMLHRCL